MRIPTHLKQLQQKSRDLRARRVDRNTYVVESISNPNTSHVVTVTFSDDGRKVRARCTCPWAMHRGIACSHVLAALEYMASQKARTLSFWQSEEEARRQKHRLFYLLGQSPEHGIWITSRSA